MSLYSGYYGSVPMVRVMVMPNSQMNTVRHTSANDRDTGEINLETVTAIGTDIPIETTRPTLSSIKKVLEET